MGPSKQRHKTERRKKRQEQMRQIAAEYQRRRLRMYGQYNPHDYVDAGLLMSAAAGVLLSRTKTR